LKNEFSLFMAPTQVLWNQLPIPFGDDNAIHPPPVEMVGLIAV
jgi:hypothetical protein